MPDLPDVLEDNVRVEVLEHDVSVVGWVGEEGDGGESPPLETDWTETVLTLEACTVLTTGDR